jgi:small-conductance mechanosensitive channel
VFSISVSYDSDLDQALDLIRQTGNEVGNDLRYAPLLLSGFDVLGLDRFDPSGAIVLAQFKTRPLKQSDITRAFNRRLKQKFDEAGIRMTSPTTMLLDRQAAGGETSEVPKNAPEQNVEVFAQDAQTATRR